MLDPLQRRDPVALLCCWGLFAGMVWVHLSNFYPDGSGLFQDDNAPIHWTQGITQWFDVYENQPNSTPMGDFGPTC